MPIYEYRCAECGAQKEILQRISDAPLTVCPECGKPALVKLVSAAGFQLKGTGWYVTDFRDKGAKPAATAGKTEKSDKSDKPADGAKPAETAAKEAPKTESAAPAPAKTAAEKN
jgi:putative FmdB family regulatory protein